MGQFKGKLLITDKEALLVQVTQGGVAVQTPILGDTNPPTATSTQQQMNWARSFFVNQKGLGTRVFNRDNKWHVGSLRQQRDSRNSDCYTDLGGIEVNIMMATNQFRWLLPFLFVTSLFAQDTGIFVGEPQIYDDRSLQLILNAARAQLAALRPIDQTRLLGHLGNLQGASLTQSQFSLQQNDRHPQETSPQRVRVVLPRLQLTIVRRPRLLSIREQRYKTKLLRRPRVLTVQNVATQPVVTPTAPTMSAPTTSLPTTYGTSALNTLSEQMQLTYEIANLELLLEGPLSDRFVGNSRDLKQHATIGFPSAFQRRRTMTSGMPSRR